MSEEDDFTRFVERTGARLGVDVKCRLMHRPGFIDDDGEWVEPYDDYEARANGRYLVLDVGHAKASKAFAELVEHEIRSAFCE